MHPRQESWIKQAALFWPKIQRVVPDNYPRNDSRTLASLADEGILTIRPLGGLTMNRLGAEFVAFLASNEAAVGTAYGLDTITTSAERKCWHSDRHLDPSLGWIHVAKVSPRARADLLASEIAIERGEWLGMHPNRADVYMCTLAGALATEGGTTPITDSELHHAGAYGWSLANVARGLLPDLRLTTEDQHLPVEAAEPMFLAVAMKAVAPANLEHVPIDRVLKLRRDHEGEFFNYRSKLADISTKLDHLRGVGDLQTLEVMARV